MIVTMDPHADLKLPTVSVAVRLAVVGAEPAAAELFIADVPRLGRSQLLDDVATMLEGDSGFLPIRVAGTVRLLGKHAMVWIAVKRHQPRPMDAWVEEPSEVITLYDRQYHVEVVLTAGTRLMGQLLDSSPADRPRAIDHLNRVGRFVRLWTQDEHFLINKAHIVQVTEV
jgi:hypothetical protein